MLGDSKLRGLSDNTRETYLHCVSVLARHPGMSPARLGRESRATLRPLYPAPSSLIR
jgi:hypothetical protein